MLVKASSEEPTSVNRAIFREGVEEFELVDELGKGQRQNADQSLLWFLFQLKSSKIPNKKTRKRTKFPGTFCTL